MRAKDGNLDDTYLTDQDSLVSDQQQYFDLFDVTKHLGRFLLFCNLLFNDDYMRVTV